MYEGYHFIGMHLAWWVFWATLIFWVFVTPYPIPGLRSKAKTPLELLKKKYASGKINKEEYLEKMHLL
ncbi:SHOCT domain-containing protein [Fulvivirga lutea]|nr:SHOCT domain-containing protein [Fulvivirga lutea]